MGLFKSIRDLAKLTKQAKRIQEQHQVQSGYQPGMGGMMSQMGDMVADAGQQMGELLDSHGDQGRLLAEGIAAEAVILAMGTPARGAQQYNLDLDLEVHLPGRAPYRVANSYIVPASVPLSQGVRLPIRVDPNDPAKIAIDWSNANHGPARGEIRPAGSSSAGIDVVAQLERLAKLRESGALTETEFEHQKARVLGSI